MDCIFCKIAAGEIPSKKVYEDEFVYAFHDINPQAPVHFLVIPKSHTASGVNDINDANCAVVGHIFAVIASLSESLGLDSGYRVITNCGADAHQSVGHLHFHVLAGRDLGEKLC